MSSTLANAIEPDQVRASRQSSADGFDIAPYFDRWEQDIQSDHKPCTAELPETHEEEESGIYIGSFPGSNCEIVFEGELHFDGYSIGNINSPGGTLLLTKRGRIEADINVGVAVISGSVTGNITATERVVLESDARVTGHIRTPALSVRLGAIFDGDCLLVGGVGTSGSDPTAPERRSDDEEYFAAGAVA